MGVLTIGNPLPYKEIKKDKKNYKDKYTDDVINLIFKYSNNKSKGVHFGEELEYCIFKVNHSSKKAKVTHDIQELLSYLNNDKSNYHTDWHPEYGDWMIEGVPKHPYKCLEEAIFNLESNLQNRRKLLTQYLSISELCPTLSIVPNLCNQLSSKAKSKLINPTSHSQYVSDKIIFPHVRFHSLTANIRERREENNGTLVNIPIEVELDRMTQRNWLNADAMAFGMGCCCLQVTLEAVDLDRCLQMFDILHTISPIMLAISASSPFSMGYLKNDNTRWNIVSDSVADHGIPLKKSSKRDYNNLPKSRFDICPCYLHSKNNDLNDVKVDRCQDTYNNLINRGIEQNLANYISHIMYFDPVLIFSNDSLQFKSHQSTVWQNVRLKFPTNETESWRAEFRPMEIQLTDFENTAMILFTVLYTKSCMSLDNNPCLTMKNNYINMSLATSYDTLKSLKLWWKDLCGATCLLSIHIIIELMLNNIYIYLDNFHKEIDRSVIQPYLDLVKERALGGKLTCAEWMRNYIKNHSEYRYDSVINKKIIFDLLDKCHKIGLENHY